MATRLLEKYKWTKDGRKWVFYTWTTSLDGKRKKYTSKAYHTKKEALEAEREYVSKLTVFTEDKGMTFKDLYEEFVNVKFKKFIEKYQFPLANNVSEGYAKECVAQIKKLMNYVSEISANSYVSSVFSK